MEELLSCGPLALTLTKLGAKLCLHHENSRNAHGHVMPCADILEQKKFGSKLRANHTCAKALLQKPYNNKIMT